MLQVLFIAIGYLLNQIVLRALLYAIMAYVVADFLSWIVTHLPTGDGGLSGAMGALPPSAWYFLDLFHVPAGIALVLAAWVTRFAIRRIPFFG